jgi:L-rhamnose mutarotase
VYSGKKPGGYMDQVLFIAKIDGTQKDKYIKYHKEMSAQFLKEKKTFGEIREFVWVHEDTAIVYLETENFEEFMKKSAETETFKEWVKKFDSIVVGDWAMPEKVFDFDNQLRDALNKEI